MRDTIILIKVIKIFPHWRILDLSERSFCRTQDKVERPSNSCTWSSTSLESWRKLPNLLENTRWFFRWCLLRVSRGKTLKRFRCSFNSIHFLRDITVLVCRSHFAIATHPGLSVELGTYRSRYCHPWRHDILSSVYPLHSKLLMRIGAWNRKRNYLKII